MGNVTGRFIKSLIIETTFVNEDFKYAVVNNMREYLEFDDKEEIQRKMWEAMNEVDEEEKVKKLSNEEEKKIR